ncbi:luciferin sulfotransferase-like [Metopolophium dirhodum]|uniref:luciferin sulfotransferase-like n=1 Tax=Metopolophium dirhodum TaxID=44670 RepID=UPI00298F9645|nr:luciferin sulfotransferase-like [Metopolophium dirhodum]
MTWCVANDLDFEGAKQNLLERVPLLEMYSYQDFEKAIQDNPDLEIPRYMSNSVEYINELKSPRYIKTHLPYQLLPKKLRDKSTKAKIIYMARNPKDTCLSFFHFATLLSSYEENFEKFCELFVSDYLCYSPFFDHILGFWDRRDDPQILFLKYEDMKKDLHSVLRQTAQFLGKHMLDDQLLALEDHLSFKSMKKNKAVSGEPFIGITIRLFSGSRGKGNIIRSGTVGEGKTKMTPELLKIFDEWENKCLEKSGLKFL